MESQTNTPANEDLVIGFVLAQMNSVAAVILATPLLSGGGKMVCAIIVLATDALVALALVLRMLIRPRVPPA